MLIGHNVSTVRRGLHYKKDTWEYMSRQSGQPIMCAP